MECSHQDTCQDFVTFNSETSLEEIVPTETAEIWSLEDGDSSDGHVIIRGHVL